MQQFLQSLFEQVAKLGEIYLFYRPCPPLSKDDTMHRLFSSIPLGENPPKMNELLSLDFLSAAMEFESDSSYLRRWRPSRESRHLALSL